MGRNISCHDPASLIITPVSSILTSSLSICPPNVLHPHRVSPMAPGFSGVHCEIDIDECNPDPCHYGTCKDSIAAFTCLCQPGYTGHRCDININECQSQPCRNGGTCQDRDNAYNCLCLKGTTGKQGEHLGRRYQRGTQPSWDGLMHWEGTASSRPGFGDSLGQGCPRPGRVFPV